MAINSKKISGFKELNSITGDEYLMVAYNNRSYKVKASLFTSDIITSIEQTLNSGDEAQSPIRIRTSGGDVYTFYVKNGAKGSPGRTGDTGKKGQTGNAGIALYNDNLENRILDTLDGSSNDGSKTYSNDELTSWALSARQGSVLNNKLESLAEEYITQDEYDERVSENRILPGVKYFIIDSE